MRRSNLLAALVLLIVVLASYGPTLKMYFWVDDWGLLFKMVHPETQPGNLGHPAYRYTALPFVFLYPLIGLNSEVYFALGLVQYYVLALAVFLFARELTQKFSVALGAAVVFASGYIGSYALFRLSNSYQLINTAIFMVLGSWALVRFYKTQQKRFYLLAMLLYLATLEFFILRAQGIVIVFLGVALLFSPPKLNIKSVFNFILRQLPFLAIYYYFYFVDTRITAGGGGAANDAFSQTTSAVLSEHNFELINNFLISFTNVLVPQPVTVSLYGSIVKAFPPSLQMLDLTQIIILSLPVISFLSLVAVTSWRRKEQIVAGVAASGFSFLILVFNVWSSSQSYSLWSPTKIEMFTSSLGGTLIAFLGWCAFIFWRKKSSIARLVPLGAIWIFGNIFSYFVYVPYTNLESTSRYVIPAFVGTALIYGALFSLVSKKVFVHGVLVAIVSLVLIKLVNEEESSIVKNISQPAKYGYEIIKKEVSKMDEKTIFYFETEDDARVKGGLLGGMPYLGVAIILGFDGEARIADSYDHLLYLLTTGRDIDNIYTFFASADDFISTTETFRNLLKQQAGSTSLRGWRSNIPGEQNQNGLITQTLTSEVENGTVGVNPSLEIDLDKVSLVPSVLQLEMTFTPVDITSFKFPYQDFSNKYSYGVSPEILANLRPIKPSFSNENILDVLRLNNERQAFLKSARVMASSSGNATPALNLLDGRRDTNWSAYDASWNGGERPEEIVIDIGKEARIEKLTWINHYHAATPTVYSIYSSNDSANWTKIRGIDNGIRREGGTMVVEDLPAPLARFIKMSIYDTYGGRGYPPAIDEIFMSVYDIEVPQEVYDEVMNCPFCYVSDYQQGRAMIELVKPNAQAKLWWVTDRGDKYYSDYSTNLPIVLDGQSHTYTIYLPAQGTKFKRLKIDSFPLPLRIGLHSVSIRSLTLQELKDKRLIKTFKE